jgi:hypothetical protein
MPSISVFFRDLVRVVVQSCTISPDRSSRFQFIFAHLILLMICGAWTSSVAQTPTVTTLTVTSGGNTVTTVAAGNTITLTATVAPQAGTVAVGQVNFCDGAAKYCTDIHIVGVAQITASGSASIKVHPVPGSYSYKAQFVGTNTFAASTSAGSPLTVTGKYPSITTIASSGTAGNYSLTATVTGLGKATAGPTGTINFVDSTAGNAVLATASLGSSSTLPLGYVASPVTGGEPSTIVAGDFNQDGNLDLAVGQYLGVAVGLTPYVPSINILIGDGNGNFTLTTGSPISTTGVPLLVQDFNQDGYPDILLGDQYTGQMSILLGNGDGTFKVAPGSPFYTNYGTSPVAVADFNGDGIPDLAVGGGYYLIVMLGKGDGSFTAVPTSKSIAGASSFGSIVAGDFNGDGIPDLATADEFTGSVNVYLGNGDGTFKAGSTVLTETSGGGSLVVLATGDFNADGKLDLIVPVYSSNSGVVVLLGNGDGTFQQANGSPMTVSNFANRAMVGDFNGDGIPDVLLGGQSSGTDIYIFLGNGDGTFTPGSTGNLSLPCCSQTVLGDFNGDRVTDAASSSFYDGSVQVLLGDAAQASATANGINAIGPGTDQVFAQFLGDTNFLSSTSSSIALWSQVNTPVLSPPAGTYAYGQTVTIADSSPDATIYYSLSPSTTVLPYSGPITLSTGGPQTIQAYATAPGSLQSATIQAIYNVNPVTVIGGLSPAWGSAGGAAFTLTVNGSGFLAASTVYWGTTPLTTQFVSGTQLTAQVTASALASAGTASVTVQNPAPGGSVSNQFQFAVVSAGSQTPPSFQTVTATVAPGASANYPVTVPSSATNLSVTCLNLPVGASCSYSASNSTVTIATTSATPAGTYQITVVFTETLPGTAAGWIFLPIFLLPIVFARRRLDAKHLWFTICLGVAITVTTLATGCGGSSGSNGTPQTHEVTTAGTISLTVQ